MTRPFLTPYLVGVLLALSACGTPTRTTAQPRQTPTPGDTTNAPTLPYLPPWNFMSLSTAGIDQFLIEHPTYDGRGVMILIFDTGIDMSIAGLEKTSAGERKVVDAIDFSNSNLVRCTRARLQGTGSNRTATGDGLFVKVNSFESLNPPPVDDALYIGVMDEAIYRNSSVRDFDGDGDSRSKFGVLLYQSTDGWRVVIDTDADSSMANETPVGSFRQRGETILFRQPGAGKSPLTFAASIDPASKSISFHYDMGGHGTHVAGIAAGYGINRETGFNGVAPGARLISGKFSADTAKDNTVTGSMRRAYEYAARLADSLQTYHIPVVVNMSFGIGSALEGRADIERFLDTLIPSHPNLYVVTSAGNEGPGLSTVGIPAGSSRIISVGALLPQGIGRDGYNAALDRDIIWDFSSRGGEVDKPDVLAPGTAVSTIPRYAYQSRESGTSMASPYTAGAVALLLSAMRQEDSTWMPTQALIRRALRSGGKMLPDYPAIEQGGGVIDVRRSYRLLKEYRESGFAEGIQNYNISTTSPNYPDSRGPTAYWRSSFVPGSDWRQSFTISRAAPRPSEEFFRAYTLQPTADWLRTVQSTVYIRNNDNASVDVIYDREKMREPGLYSARVIGRRASAGGPAAEEEIEFELVNTVIVPYLFSADKGYQVSTPPQKLPAGVTRRYYFAPPAGAAAITFTLSVPKGSGSLVYGKIADRFGVNVAFLPRVKGTERNEASNTIDMKTLGEGVIEVIVQADAFEVSGGQSEYTLSASVMMLQVSPTVEKFGNTSQLKVVAVNTGSDIIRGDFNYTIKGYGRTVRDTMRGDTWSMPLVMRKTDGALWISPRFSEEDYMRATDILVRIVDESGYVQSEEALNTPSTWLFLPNFNRSADSTRFRLQIIFGASDYEQLLPIPIEIVENHMRPSDPKSIGGYGGIDLYPYIPQTLTTKLPSASGLDTPRGFTTIGEVGFKMRDEEQTIPFDFNLSP